jgi:hypothetical protein
LLEQGQKIAASIDYALDPDGFSDHTKQDHVPTHNRHSRTLTDFGP